MRLLLGFVVFFFWGSIVRTYYVCEVKGRCEEEVIESTRPKTLSLVLDDTIKVLKDYEQFAFPLKAVQPDLSENNAVFLDSLASYLNKDTSKNLTITGFFRESESGFSAGIYEDFGKARASTIRQLLVDRGIDEQRIFIDGLEAPGEKLLEPLRFDLFTVRDGIPDEYSNDNFSFKNMTYSDANFEYNSSVFSPGDAFQLYADSVKTFLELNPEWELRIVGHCDSVGTDAYNDKLGQDRAENTKVYFSDLGVVVPITTESQGRRKPIVPNDTEENRQTNRRVQILIEPKVINEN